MAPEINTRGVSVSFFEAIAHEVDATFDAAKSHLPTIELIDRVEKCRRLALLALTHPCPRNEAVDIWEGRK